MAILALDSVTLAAVVDVDYMRKYYLLQASTLAPPAVPTTNPPLGSWSTVEPGYTAGSTNTLYTTDLLVFSDDTFDYLPVQKSSAYEAAKQAYNLADANKYIALQYRDETISRGTDLVTNGTGLMGTNNNFASFTFDGTDAPVGANGSFRSNTYMATKFNDEFIPIDPSKKYILSVAARQTVAGKASRAYVGLAPFDAQNLSIAPHMYVHDLRTNATLTAALNPGATTMKVSSLTAAYWTHTPAYKYVGVWNWTDPAGRTWPLGTYTRNTPAFSSVDEATKTITLASPYSGPAMPVGTPITRNFPGGNYMYTAPANHIIPETWTTYRSIPIGGLYNGNRQSTANAATEFPAGCAKVKIVFLVNRDVTGGEHAWASISLSDASAAQETAETAQDTADEAKAIANRKTAMYTQPTVPTAPPGGFTIGDLWIDNGPFLTAFQNGTSEDTGGGITKRWDGFAWIRTEQTIDASEIRGGFIKAGIAIWSGGNIVAGNIFGVCAVMDNFGFKTLKVMDDVQYTSLSLGNPAGKDSIEIFDDPANPPVFAVSEKGDVSANDLTLAEDPFVKGKTLLGKVADPESEDGWLDDFTSGVVGFGNFRGWAGDGRKAVAPNATSVTAGIGYMTFQMKAGRSYKVTMPYHYHCTSVIGSAGRCHVYVRYTWGTGGAKPTSVPNDSSSVVALDVKNHTATANYQSSILEFVWISPFSVDTWVTLYVSIVASNCTMQPTPSTSPVGSWIITAEDFGKIPEDTAEEFVINAPPVQPKSNYVSTWSATSSRNYLSNGNPSSLTIDTARNILRHGYYDGQAGDSRSVWVVATNTAGVGNDGGKTLSAALTGATITKVEIWVQSVHWYYSTGGTLIYRPLKSSTLPATLTNAQAPAETGSKKFTGRSQGFWIPVPTSWVSATGVGFVYGPAGSNSNTSYGYFAGPGYSDANARPKVRISYTR